MHKLDVTTAADLSEAVVVTVTGYEDTSRKDWMEIIDLILTGAKSCRNDRSLVIIGLRTGQTLETASEDDMREAGWVRAAELERLQELLDTADAYGPTEVADG